MPLILLPLPLLGELYVIMQGIWLFLILCNVLKMRGGVDHVRSLSICGAVAKDFLQFDLFCSLIQENIIVFYANFSIEYTQHKHTLGPKTEIIQKTDEVMLTFQ